MDLYNLIWSLTLFPRGIIIFQGVLTKFNFAMKFPIPEKFVNLMKDQKYEHQSIFPFWGRIKLNFRNKYGKPNIFLKNSSRCQVKFFTKLSKNDTLASLGVSDALQDSRCPLMPPVMGGHDRQPP